MTDRNFKAVDRQGNVVDFELKMPSLNEENEGERQYRVAYSKALVEGVFPREKLREIMQEHGMWTVDDDKSLKKCVGKIALLQIELKNRQTAGDTEGCVEIAEEIDTARLRMWELFLIQQSVYMNSAEGVAELVKTEAIMAACTLVKSTGKRYWESYKDYVTERDFNDNSTVYSHVVEVQSRILDEARDGLLDEYPEREYLKSAEDRMMDRELQEEVQKTIQNRAKKAVDKSQAEEKETKPAPRRKKAVRKTRRKTSGKAKSTEADSA